MERAELYSEVTRAKYSISLSTRFDCKHILWERLLSLIVLVDGGNLSSNSIWCFLYKATMRRSTPFKDHNRRKEGKREPNSNSVYTDSTWTRRCSEEWLHPLCYSAFLYLRRQSMSVLQMLRWETFLFTQDHRKTLWTCTEIEVSRKFAVLYVFKIVDLPQASKCQQEISIGLRAMTSCSLMHKDAAATCFWLRRAAFYLLLNVVLTIAAFLHTYD